MKNNGWEASASVYVIRNAERDINWIIGGQLTYNKNYVSKLSEAIKAQNEAYLKEDVDVANLFYEGRPQNGIYVVRSLGIDPANGQEIFLDKDGNRKNLSDWLGNYVILVIPDAGFVLLHTILPNMAYSLVLSPLIYLITKLIAQILAKRE